MNFYEKITGRSFIEKIKDVPKNVRKLLAVTCAFTLVSASVPFVSLVTQGAQVPVYAKTTDYLNLRKGAGVNYDVVEVIDKGATVTAIGRTNSNWLKVRLADGKTGYCSGDYLDIITDASTTDYLNLRSGVGTDYPVIETLAPGERLDILEFCNKSWAEVKLDTGKKGYVCTDYIEYIGSDSVSQSHDSKKTPSLTSLKLQVTSKTMNVGSIHTIKPVYSPSNGRVKYTTSNKSVATVTETGTVKGVGAGTANITVYDPNGSLKAVLHVKINDKMTISKTSANIYVDDVLKLKATTTSGGKFTWSSSNKKVATVTSDGTVKGISSGSAVITATDSKNKRTVKCNVKVSKVVLTSLKLQVTSKTMDVGSIHTIKPVYSPSNGKVKYSTSNKSVATVTETGTVKGVGAGTANITVYDPNGSLKAVLTVKINDKMTISKTSETIEVGGKFTLSATTTSGGKFTWSSSNKNTATVSSGGVVKGVAAGTATITAKDSKNGRTLKCTVKVVKTSIKSIELSEKSKTLLVGESYAVKPKVTPSDKKVAYSTSNKSIATVTSSGTVKAVKAGQAKISVYDPNGSKQASLNVTVQKLPTISISKKSVSIDAGANVTLSAKLSNGASVSWSTSNSNVASVRQGVVSGIKAGTAKITASDSSGKVKVSCTVTVKGVSSNGVSLSRYSASTTAGKTIYIKGYSTYSASWGTSNSNIATVRDGFIQTKNPGKVAITYTDVYGRRAICAVTVSDAAPIRFTYSSPNSAVLNSNVKLVAITDKTRTAVKFVITINGKKVTLNASEKKADGNTYVWSGTYKATIAGTLDYKAYSYKNSKWSTCSDGEADIYVTTKTNVKTTTTDRLRASDEVIKFIGEKEGFVSKITYDTLANNIPTLGYGYVVWEGWKFYDNLTKNEAYALLVNAVNQEVYASRVNDMFAENKIRFNQQQFDALVSFSYNLGTGWTYSSDLLDILCNSYGPSKSSGTVTATVDANGGLYLRKSYTTSSDAITLMPDGTNVTLVSTDVYNGVWYKVKTPNGKVGYCSGTYLNLHYSSSTVRDLAYVNKNALIKEMLAYHHAGGICYYGLLYRRADELEMFLYADYVSDGKKNKHNFPDPYCISW